MRIDYVGTRGLHEPFQVGLNGYQTVCAGCFAPYPYQQPLDQRFGSVNEFRTDANSSYSGLQASVTEQLRSFTLRANYTLSHCLDEVSNGGLLSFSTQGILSPLPGELSRQYGDCDYDVRQNISAFGIYAIPFASAMLFCAHSFAAGRSRKRRSFTPAFPSVCSASPTRPMATAFFKPADRSLRAAFPASRFTAKQLSPA